MENETFYHCSAEWHLAQLQGKGATIAALIYNWAFRLSKQTGIFHASIPRMSAYFDRDEKTIRKALRLLVKLGFFDVVRQAPGATVCYKPVRHDDWRRTHPHDCAQRLAMPWDDEPQDKLAQVLYGISGGQCPVYANVLKGIRKTGHGETAIKKHFVDFIVIDQPVGKRWGNGFHGRFIKYLKTQPVVPDVPQPAATPVRATSMLGRAMVGQL